MTKEATICRKLIGKRVKIARGEYSFVGLLLGQIEVWRQFAPEVSARYPKIRTWGAVSADGELYFDPTEPGVEVIAV